MNILYEYISGIYECIEAEIIEAERILNILSSLSLVI